MKYAQRLVRGDLERARDLVQDTILRALENEGKFQPGTNMKGWLGTILFRLFVGQYRREGRFVEDPDELNAARMMVPPGQIRYLETKQFLKAFEKLPRDQRRALYLIGFLGHQYDEAAKIEGVAEGTIKSRVHRGRMALLKKIGSPVNDDVMVSVMNRTANIGNFVQ